MKVETAILALALTALLGLAGMGAYNTMAGNRETALALAWEKRDTAMAEAYWLRVARQRSYQVPVDGPISSATGYRTDPMGGTTESLHQGVDIVGEIGTPVRAALAGRVAEHWPAPDGYYKGHPVYGAYIVLDHGDGLLSKYGHFDQTFVHTGDWVEQGQIIGTIGSTGISTGAHLHWEVVVNPLRYFGGEF